MAHGVHGRGVIDLRKRHAGAAQETRRTLRLELPVQRRTSLRIRRRKLRILAALVVLILAGGIVYSVSELTYMPTYAIDEVRVEGTENVPPRLVRAFVETKLNDGTHPIISRGNIFLYPKAEIAKNISEYFPRIFNAQISREGLLAQAITVTVKERQPFAIWCQRIGNNEKAEGNRHTEREDECFDMDEGGFVFAESAASTSTGMLVFTGELATSSRPIGQTFLPGQFAGVLALLNRLQDGGFPATSVSVENEQDFAVSLAERFVLRASFGADADSLVRNLQDVLSSDSLREKENTIEYVDLRFGNRVYYKAKSL